MAFIFHWDAARTRPLPLQSRHVCVCGVCVCACVCFSGWVGAREGGEEGAAHGHATLPHLRSSSAGGSPASSAIVGTAPRKSTGASPRLPALPASIAAAPVETAAAGTEATLFSSLSCPI